MLGKGGIRESDLKVREWGGGVLGGEAAARHYFGVDASRVSTAEASRLAAMIPSPRYYDGHGVTPALRERSEVLRQRIRRVRIP